MVATTRFLSSSALLGCIALTPAFSDAPPLVFEETVTITTPDPTFHFPGRVAVEGDTIIATGLMTESNGDIQHHAAFLFRTTCLNSTAADFGWNVHHAEASRVLIVSAQAVPVGRATCLSERASCAHASLRARPPCC
jgi:hypothetical protein